MAVARANPSTQQTDTSLVAAPGANQAIRVYAVFISSDTQLNVLFEEGSTTLDRQYVAANGGSVLPFTKHGWFDVSVNTALTYTTSAAGNVYIHVVYGIISG